MKKFRQLLSLCLVISMLCGMVVFPVSAEETITPITGGETISANGSYQVTEGSTGTITVAEGVTKVTIIGSGAQWDQDPASATYGAVTSTGYTGLMIDCAAAPGVTLTLKDIFISNSFIGDNTIDFAGTGNTLIFDGTVVIDHDNNAQGYAGIHVKKGDSLNIYGTTGSSFYMYKREQAAGIGANNQEACGTITFGTEGGANDFWFYMKGTKQGAVIGNGANCPETPGDITFYSGIYNMVANARGALIGGSAGPSSFDAGNVYIQGGLLNLNVDYSGASIGGGGYATGNDKEGGNVYMIGGSVRPYIDTNAISSWSSYGVTEAGVDDVTITANKLNADGEPVYMMAVDTTGMDADTYTIQVDGQTYYTGSRYAYCYCYENTDRDVDNSVYPNGTPGNWIPLTSENNFYLFVTGEDHVVTVNGEDITYAWDDATETFTAQADEEEPTEEPTEAPHEHSYEAVVTDPTCTEGGYTTYTCECGDTYTADETEALGHSYENGTCTVCGEADPDYVAPTYAWYEAGTETASYTISTAEELAQLAAIVNGTDEIYAQDNFSGKTVSLAGDIVLAEDGLYTAIENVTYGSSSWPMTTTQYVISAEAPVWTPIGSGSASGNTVSSTANAFAGTFDGKGYTVSGIYTGTTDSTTANTATVQGLFGIVTGTVKNVTVSGCVTGNSVVGGVVAYLNGGTVENCVNNAIVFADGGTTPNGGSENGTSRAGATGGIVGLAAGTGSVTGCTNNAAVICANTAKGGRVGGIVGLIDQSGDAIAISKCVNNGAVEGYQYVAGICGMNYAKNSPIDRCVNTANITMHGGGKAHAGGIAGQFDCQITNCYNTGNIHATHTTSQEPRYFGGIAGDYNYTTGNGKIINCYTTGTVTYDFGSARDTGIIVGESGYAVNSYFLDEALTGSGSAVAQFDGISRTVSDMYYNATFVLKLGEAYRYDANKINNGYPVLDWQGGDEVRSVEIVVEGAADQITFSKEVPMGFRYTGTPTTCMIKPTVAEGYAITNIAWTENCDNAYISDKSGYLFIEKCTGDVTVTLTVEKVVVNYTVTLTEGENYTIAPVDGYTTTVEAGSEFKFTVTAADGYSITEVKAGDTVLTADENGVYTITVDADVVVTVAAEKICAPYTITTAEELLMLAQEVNAGETKLGETYTLGNDIDLSTVCSEELGTWNAIGGAAEKIVLDINSQEELNEKLEQYNIIYDDTGWSYKYGTDKNLPYDENRTYYAVEGKIFSGTFDGAGYTIENLYVLSETGYAGLFGNVDGTLKNFTVKGSVTTATGTTEVDFVGGVTGKLSEGGRIENVVSYVDVDASAKAYNVGGIAGFCGTKNATASNKFSSAENTFIIECVNYGSVYGWSQVGGIAGENAGQILRCANYGDVDGLKSGSKAGIGGIAGRNGCNNTAYTAGTVIDCYNFGTIATSDNKWCGGIVGFNNAESEVRNCYNVGTVNGTGQANAICGQNEGTGDNGVYNCWYLDSTKVFDESGVYGGKYADCGPKTEAEMKDPVFAAILGSAFNVDSENINSGYPVLKFQGGSEAPAIYTVTIPEKGEGYTVSVADGYTTTVVEGGEFKFSIYLLDGYRVVSVKAGERELTAENGVYTIENITSDVTVTIDVQIGVNVIASGWSGYTTWTLTDNGVLTFSPTDQTENGQCNLRNYWKVNGVLTLPWGAYAEQITKVVIEDGIHDIGQMAFYELPNLTTVELGKDVIEVRNYAFKNCVSLTSINLDSVQNICEGAFYGCSALTEVTLAEDVTIGDWAFSRSGVILN